MKKRIVTIGLISFAVVTAALAGSFFFLPTTAQKSGSTRYEYAVINGSYSPYPAENPSVVSSAVNVCYMQSSGCQNEEVRSDVNIAKFLQDERLENNARARTLAQERAVQTAFSKAIAKLGNEGWEIVTAPTIEFDLIYTNPQGVQSVKEAGKTERQHIWFKRVRQ